MSKKIPLTEQGLLTDMRRSPYGRCVYLCPVDVVDHQLVQATFENGVKASLKMLFSGEPSARRYVFYGTMGEMIFDERSDSIEVLPFGGEREVISVSSLVTSGEKFHGGGDASLVRELYELLTAHAVAPTTLEESVESHLMGAAAEESRREGGTLKLVHA